MDVSAIDAAMSAVLAAIAKYGRDVLGRVEGIAADATVNLGLKLLGRFRSAKGAQKKVEEAVGDVVNHPGEGDYAAALRVQVRKILDEDAELAADVERLVRESGVSVSASGQRAAAIVTNSGIISLGDGANNRIQR